MIERGPPSGDWHYELITPGLLQVEQRLEVFFRGETSYQHVEVMDGATFGRTLILDGKTQSTEVDEFVYHEALVHPTMIVHPEPMNVFVAGGGEGATIREVLSHTMVNQVVMVDIDEKVVELCKEYLPNHHKGSFDDPRVVLHHMDALRFLQDTSLRFDVVIIDVPDPLETGPAYLLFTKEFYSLVKERLKPDGMIVAQSGPTGPAFYEQCFSAVAKTMHSVFPQVYISEAFIPSFGTTWGFVVGSTGPDLTSLSVSEADARIKKRIKGELRFLDGITLRGMTSVPKYLREAVDSEHRIITTANPIFVE